MITAMALQHRLTFNTNRFSIPHIDDDLVRKLYNADYGSFKINAMACDSVLNTEGKIDFKKTHKLFKDNLVEKDGTLKFFQMSYGVNGSYGFFMRHSKEQIPFTPADYNFRPILDVAVINKLKEILSSEELIDFNVLGEAGFTLFLARDLSNQKEGQVSQKYKDKACGLKVKINITSEDDRTIISFDAVEALIRKNDDQIIETIHNYESYKKIPSHDNKIPFINMDNPGKSHLYLMLLLRRAIVSVFEAANIPYENTLFEPSYLATGFRSLSSDHKLDDVKILYKEEDRASFPELFDFYIGELQELMKEKAIKYLVIPYDNIIDLQTITSDGFSIILQIAPQDNESGFVRCHKKGKENIIATSDYLHLLDRFKITGEYGVLDDYIIDDYTALKIETYKNQKTSRTQGFTIDIRAHDSLKQNVGMLKEMARPEWLARHSVIDSNIEYAHKNALQFMNSTRSKIKKVIEELSLKSLLLSDANIRLPFISGCEEITVRNVHKMKNIATVSSLTFNAVNINDGVAEYSISDIVKYTINKTAFNNSDEISGLVGRCDYGNISFGDYLIVTCNPSMPFRCLTTGAGEEHILEWKRHCDKKGEKQKSSKSVKGTNPYAPRILPANSVLIDKKVEKTESQNSHILVHYTDGKAVMFFKGMPSSLIKGGNKLSKDIPLVEIELYKKENGEYVRQDIELHQDIMEWYLSLIPYDTIKINQISKMNILQKLCNLLCD
ncbi:MAG TPA: hypothetical protein DCS83_03485 [Prevotella sp.]|nr:hypothetical protein [Prevotella sp.]